MREEHPKPRDLRHDRSLFVLGRLDKLRGGKTAARLKSAPMEIRSLGLPLASASWDRDKLVTITQLVSKWLYAEWGLLSNRAAPQDATALLTALRDEGGPALFSAAEREAEEILQVAKILVEASEET